MKNEKYIDLITGYLLGTLTPYEWQRLDELANQGKIDWKEIHAMKTLFQQLDVTDIPEPSSALNERFYAMLENEKLNQQANQRRAIRDYIDEISSIFRLRLLAYALSIFLVGLIVGDMYAPLSNRDTQIDRLSSEVTQLREMMMISLLDDTSPIERLKAVNISYDIHSVDDRMVEALLRTLNNDPNVNVRMAAVEALVRHGSNPMVRKGLVNAISRQESPIVQSSLADAMLELQEKQSIDEFQKLLERDGLDSTVRNKLQTTIAALN